MPVANLTKLQSCGLYVINLFGRKTRLLFLILILLNILKVDISQFDAQEANSENVCLFLN